MVDMNDLLVALAVLLTSIAAIASVYAAVRAGRPAQPDQGAAIQAAQLAAMVQGLVEQSNRDRESVQQALAAGAKGTTEQLQQVGERVVRLAKSASNRSLKMCFPPSSTSSRQHSQIERVSTA